MNKNIETALLILILTGLHLSCCRNEHKASFPVLTINGHRLRVETAVTRDERSRGLMHRKHLPADRGMLFVYFRESELSFWMKNTFIPLSIAFVDAQGTIAEIRHMEPGTTDSHTSGKPVLYAIEVNRGWFDKHGIKPGDTVKGLKEIFSEDRAGDE